MISTVFSLLVGTFAFIIGLFFIPVVGEIFKGPLFLLPFIVFFLLGLILVFLTLKKKRKGKLEKLLLLTGVSASGVFIGILLHNLLYALGMIVDNVIFLKYLVEALHVIFFFLAILVCPIGFLIGMVGSSVLFIKKKRKKI